jgi:cytochrome c-type biogenesis protein
MILQLGLHSRRDYYPFYLPVPYLCIRHISRWTPCIGPMLGTIIGMAAVDPANGLLYMFVYVLGFSLPFFIFAYFFTAFKRIHKYSGVLMKFGGAVLIILGILLVTNKLAIISNNLNDLFNFTGIL